MSSLLTIAHAADNALERVLRFCFWISHDIFISRESLFILVFIAKRFEVIEWA